MKDGLRLVLTEPETACFSPASRIILIERIFGILQGAVKQMVSVPQAGLF